MNSDDKEPGNEEPGDYEVGYGKPPLHTRFKKGHSGNPNGRPQGSKSFPTLLNKALQKSVVLRKNGRTMTKMEVIVEQLTNRGASGDFRAMKLLFVDLAQYLHRELKPRRSRGLSDVAAARIRSPTRIFGCQDPLDNQWRFPVLTDPCNLVPRW